MKFLQSIAGNRFSILRTLGRRSYAVNAEEYERRNYANNETEYNTVIGSITSQRKNFLLRDVYDDMMLDGVKPHRDTFHLLVAGSLKGTRLQDALYYKDEMKSMGLVPDVAIFNYLISLCGKCKQADQATKIFEEMKISGEVKPTGQTFICLLNAFAASGHIERVYAIVRDMTAAGLGLNKFCYAGLIAAHKNRTPRQPDAAAKILELVTQSKNWSSVEASTDNAENANQGITEEDLYGLPTADYTHRRGRFVHRPFAVYHAAFHALADMRETEATDTLLKMLQKENAAPDLFIHLQTMRCFLHAGDLDRGLQIFEDYMNSGKQQAIELYKTLIAGAMTGYTPKGMKIALDALTNMTSRNFFLNPKMGNDLLWMAAAEQTGGYEVANMLWELMERDNIVPNINAVERYKRGLEKREVPADDPRLMNVIKTYNNVRNRVGIERAVPTMHDN